MRRRFGQVKTDKAEVKGQRGRIVALKWMCNIGQGFFTTKGKKMLNLWSDLPDHSLEEFCVRFVITYPEPWGTGDILKS